MAEASIKHIGRYEIQAELGRGGYGRVYRAYDPTVGRLVAIKVLTGEGTDLLKRFRNEASAAGSLNHRNIVTIYDFGEHDGMPYIAMEFLAGDDLSQIIANRTPLTMLQKVNIMMQVAEGLYSAHRNGVVHRDVKPANIRLLPDGTVKILDFGIARLTRDSTSPRLTRQGDVIGTLLYMSPEQIMSADVDALSDIFAYGVTYYELLTGKHPFHAADAGAVLYKITSVDPEPIHNHTPECPEALEQVVRRALHRERELRYQSLRELQIDTEPILIELRQKQASVLLNDARNCFAEDDLERAEAHVMEALALDPSNTAGREFRTEVQQRLQSRRLQSRIEAILAEGDHALKQRRFAEAAERFQSALQVYPKNEKLKGRLQQARELLERSRAAAQLLAEARKHFFQKDYSAALRIASEAAQIDPECTDVARFVQSVQTAAEREERRLRFQQVLAAAQELLDQNLFDQAAAALAELDLEQRDSAEAKALIESVNTRRAEFERAEREQAERIRTELAAATEELRNSAFLQAFERLSTLRREVPENEDIGRLLALAEKELSAQKRAAEIDVLVREALSFVESDQYGRALSVIEDGLRSYAGDARLLQLLEEVKAGQERIASIRSALAGAKAQLEAGRPEEAVQVLEPVLAKFAGEAQLERVLRQAREALQKKQKAEAIERAEREAQTLAKAKEFDKAVDVIEAVRRQHGDDPALARLKERIESDREERRRAVAVQTTVANAESLVNVGQPEEAIRVLESASAEFGGEAELERVLGQAREALQRKQKAEAVERAEREAQTLAKAEELDKALDVIEAVRRQHGDDPALARLTERIESDRERRRRAFAVQTAAANAEALVKTGKPEEAIHVLEAAMAEFAGEAHLEQGLGRVRIALQQKQKAEAIERAEREVQSLVEAGEFERAVAVIAAVRREHGDDPALAPLTERITKEREERRRTAAVQTAVANAEALIQAGKPEEAIRVLEPASAEFAGEAELEGVLGQAREALQKKLKAEAVERAKREVQSLVEAGEFERAVAVIAAVRREHGDDPALAPLTERIAKWREERRRVAAVQTAVANAEALVKTGKPEEAIHVLEAAASGGEAQLERALRQARDALQGKQKAEAIEHAVREVQALVEAGEFDKALAAIDAVRREHGDDPAFARLTERIGTAREERRRAVAVQTTVANAESLIKVGQPEEALRVLEAATAEFAGEPQLGRVLAQAREALKQKQKAEAIEHAAREVQALVEAGEFDKAQKSLKAALKKYPQEGRLLELRNQIQTARAGRELEQARPPQEVPQQLEPKLAERSRLITPRRAIAVAAVLVAGIGAVLVVRQINAPAGGTIPVEVRTSPAGAVVRYKDASCTPPDCRLQLAPGDYVFEVQLPGYRTETRKTTVVKNSAPVSLEIALSALPSTVQLTTTFADGSVTLDGRPAGRLRDGQFIADNLGPGRHELEAKGGDGDIRLTFETGEAKRPLLSSPPSTRDADAVVVTAFGSEVAVNCARCNGEAVLDGKPVGRFVGGQLTLKGVSAGTHELQVGGGAAPRKLVFAVGTQPSLVTYLTSARDRGILLVQTGLDDAVVYIGGKQWPRRTERGELSIPLDAKEYEVRVEKQGYRAVPPVVRAAVRKGEQVRAPFRLEPLEAVLTITGQVPGATVTVDRKLAGAVGGNGVFSVQVQPGERRIELSKDGYQPVAISRSISPGERLQLGTDQVRLQPIPKPAPEPAPVKAASPPPPPQPSPAELEVQQWQRVRDSRDISDLAEFLTRYPGGRFAREAEARIEELDWSATNKNNLASLEAFLAKHPRGTLVGEARKEIARLQQEEQRRSEAAAVLATVSRYEEAYRRRDAPGVRALYLDMPNNQFDQIRKSFSVFQVISFQLKPEEPQVAGDTATVRCVRMLTVKDNRGAQPPVNDVALFRLKKEGNEWRIVSLSTLN